MCRFATESNESELKIFVGRLFTAAEKSRKFDKIQTEFCRGGSPCPPIYFVLILSGGRGDPPLRDKVM